MKARGLTLSKSVNYLLAGAGAAAGAAAGVLAGAASAVAGAAVAAGAGAGECTASAPCFSPLISKLSPPLEMTNKARPANTINPTTIFHIGFSIKVFFNWGQINNNLVNQKR
jgi:hypothetical protein